MKIFAHNILILLIAINVGCYRSNDDDSDDSDEPQSTETAPIEEPSSDTVQTATGDTVHHEGDEYDQGVYHCCAEGDGTNCCQGYEQGMCYKYGGIYETCIGQGEEYEGKVICAHCCEGLEQTEAMIVTDEDWTQAGYPTGCGPSPAPPSILICVNCSDGICGAGENACICPEDCS